MPIGVLTTGDARAPGEPLKVLKFPGVTLIGVGASNLCHPSMKFCVGVVTAGEDGG